MTTQTQPAPNLLVYLYAEQFASPVKGLGALTGGMVAPRSGEKVNLQQLATNLYVAAVMELVQSKTVSLDTVEVKKLFGKENALALKLEGTPAAGLSVLASRIVQQIQAAQKPADRRVREIVIRIVGGRESTQYPWLLAAAPVIAAAENEGYIQRPEKKAGLMKSVFNPLEANTQVEIVAAAVAPLEAGVGALKQQMQQFEQSLGAQAAALRKEIENGINDCRSHSD